MEIVLYVIPYRSSNVAWRCCRHVALGSTKVVPTCSSVHIVCNVMTPCARRRWATFLSVIQFSSLSVKSLIHYIYQEFKLVCKLYKRCVLHFKFRLAVEFQFDVLLHKVQHYINQLLKILCWISPEFRLVTYFFNFVCINAADQFDTQIVFSWLSSRIHLIVFASFIFSCISTTTKHNHMPKSFPSKSSRINGRFV